MNSHWLVFVAQNDYILQFLTNPDIFGIASGLDSSMNPIDSSVA